MSEPVIFGLIAVATLGGVYLLFRENAIYDEILYRASEHGSRAASQQTPETLRRIGNEVNNDLRFWPFPRGKK